MWGRSGSSDSRYVLVICYDFPGIGTAGVIRTYQLAKHLPLFGWQPIILTAQPCSVDQEDNIETSDGRLHCPKVTVQAPKTMVPFQNGHHVLSNPPHEAANNGNGLLKPVVRLVTQLALPDGKIGWLPFAVERVLQFAQQCPIEMCFSVSPRPTSHFVARQVARRLGIPWVADFALPWSDAYWFSGRPRFIGWFDQQLEGLVVRSARHVTVAYPEIARSMCTRFGVNCRKKISVVPTGFSDDLFADESAPTPAKVTVVYAGNHFCEEGRHGDSFLKAVDAWIGWNPELADQVEFVFIGKRDDDLLRHRAAMAHPEVVRVEPLISHRACIQTILASHVCIVNTVGNRIPGKTYECMRAGKWTLALTDPGSDLDTLMRQYSRGISVPARDVAAIRHALHNVWQTGDLKASGRIDADPAVEMYSSKHSAAMVAHIFDGLLVQRIRESCQEAKP